MAELLQTSHPSQDSAGPAHPAQSCMEFLSPGRFFQGVLCCPLLTAAAGSQAAQSAPHH